MSSNLDLMKVHTFGSLSLSAIQITLIAIPLYLLSVFKAPSYFFKCVQSLVTNFLWKSSSHRGVCWKKWVDLCKPMGLGGLRFRDLKTMNQALLAKTAWRMYKNPQSLLSQTLLSKYCHNQNFWPCTASAHSSWGWKEIIWGKQLLKEGLGMAVRLICSRNNGFQITRTLI